MYTKSIDVKNNQVFLTENEGTEVDCAVLGDIVFYAEQGNQKWVERDPFNGRETDFDQAVVDSLFAQAEAIKLQQEQDAVNQPPEPVTRISPRQARLQLLVLEKFGQVEPAIESMPEPQKTQARIEWEYATFYERTNPFIVQMGTALEIDLDQFFIDANKI